MNACGPHCGYCGRCETGPPRDWVERQCPTCHRWFWQSVKETGPVCDSCALQRDDIYRRERAGGVWPW